MEKEAQLNIETEEEQKKKKKKILLVIFLLLLALAVVVIICHELGYFRYPWDNDRTLVISGDLFPGSTGEAGALPGMSEEDLKAQMQRAADKAQFSYKLNARPVFKDGKSEGNWEIENPNYNVYPIVIQVTLDDTGEIIYDSGGLLPNQHIETGKLTKILKAGEYPATATINMYHPETNEAVGKTQAGLIITVLE